ncbi:MAG: hypothetical protein QW057_01020 [Candidatus Bathyarchaeia archaeon]
MSRERRMAPSVFHHLERMIGRRLLVTVEPDFGFEGTLTSVSDSPPGVWLSDSEAVILRSTVGRPIPEVVSREEKSELFLNLNHIQRIEVLHREAAPDGRENKDEEK